MHPAAHFDHLVACGVFHFVPELESILVEAARLLKPDGILAFTTRFPTADLQGERYTHHLAGDFEIFSHSQHYIAALLKQYELTRLKLQKCFISEDIFLIWVAQKASQP